MESRSRSRSRGKTKRYHHKRQSLSPSYQRRPRHHHHSYRHRHRRDYERKYSNSLSRDSYTSRKHHRRHYHRRNYSKKRKNSPIYSSRIKRSSYKISYYITESSQSSDSGKKKKYDSKEKSKDAGHYQHKIGEFIKHYKVIDFLSDGTFGRCLRVLHTSKQEIYALKIIRAVDRYIESAETEVEIIQKLKKEDANDHVVTLQESFHFGRNYCIVFEELGLSLYDLLKKNSYKGFSKKLVQSFSRQMIQAVGFLHSQKLTHTDLKPENVLLQTRELIENKSIQYKFGNKEKDKSESTASLSRENYKPYFVPSSDKIKIIDFGGATFEHEHKTRIINTRQYRAPEVILGCTQWTCSSDVWSLACIIVELYTGNLYFPTHNDFEHLAMMEKSSGPFPQWMANRAENGVQNYFREKANEKGSYLIFPKGAEKEMIEAVDNFKTLENIFGRDVLIIDLLKKMMKLDPTERITCQNALEHAYFAVEYQI